MQLSRLRDGWAGELTTMSQKPYAVWSLPANRIASKFLGDAQSLSDAFKFKTSMEWLGHTDVKVIDVLTGQESADAKTLLWGQVRRLRRAKDETR
jgi:hypothetical protein